MALIVKPDFLNGMMKGDTEFSLRLLPGNVDIDLKFNGDPKTMMKMIYVAMSTHEHIAQTIITAVLIFADQKGIPVEQLKKHSYLDNSKIIKP